MHDASDTPRPRHWLVQAAVIFWVVLILVTTAKNLIVPYRHTVFFPAYAQTGRTWWFPERYSAQERDTYQSRQYGPFFSELVGPVCMLPDRLAGTVWSLASIGVLVWGFHRFLTRVVPGSPETGTGTPSLDGGTAFSGRLLPIDGLGSPSHFGEPVPVSGQPLSEAEWGLAFLILPWVGLSSLYNGQANVLITGCLLGGVAAVATSSWFVASLCLAIPACIKTYPIVMALVLLVLWPRRLAPRFLLALAALCALPFALHPAGAVWERYQGWIEFLGSGEHYTTDMLLIDLRAVLCRTGFPITPRAYIPVQVTSGGAVLAGVLAARQRGGDSRTVLVHAYVLTSLWMVLFGPATEPATYLLAGPAVAWTLVELFCRRRSLSHGWTSQRKRWAVYAMVLAGAVLAGPLQTSILGETVRRFVLAGRLAPLGLAILFAYRLAIAFHPTPATARSATIPGYGNVGRAA